jgi:hypothetical protein
MVRAPIVKIVVLREGGGPSIPDAALIYGEAAAYWIPRLRGV